MNIFNKSLALSFFVVAWVQSSWSFAGTCTFIYLKHQIAHTIILWQCTTNGVGKYRSLSHIPSNVNISVKLHTRRFSAHCKQVSKKASANIGNAGHMILLLMYILERNTEPTIITCSQVVRTEHPPHKYLFSHFFWVYMLGTFLQGLI